MKLNREIFVKIKRKIWQRLVKSLRNKTIYPLIYLSWWSSKNSKGMNRGVHIAYMSAVPNPGAGIGHQMANWIAGYWFAQKFNLPFSHSPFTGVSWEKILGFGDGEIAVEDLVRNAGYKKVLLPLFDEYNKFEVVRTKKIIESYVAQKVVFVLEQDQFYRDQFGVINVIQDKFYRSCARNNFSLSYDSAYLNIAIHVRRGDISHAQASGNPNLLLRWQDSCYFENVLKSLLDKLSITKPVRIYLFSQGRQEDFSGFEQLGEVKYCLDMEATDSFLHMVFADILITSKSSFSYKPALLSRGIKICPKNFWHGYPNDPNWILADEDGSIECGENLNLLTYANFDVKNS